MKKTLTTFCLTIAVLLGSVGESFALPECEGSPLEITSPSDVSEWNNCKGTFIVGPTVSGFAGEKYVGEFKDGKNHGQGIQTFSALHKNAGYKYVGEYKGGKKNGQGTATFAKSGNKYVGEFKDGNFNGQGTYTFPNGNKYVGEFKDGKRNGQGTFTFANGDKYVGEFKDDKRNGQGTYYYLADNRFKGDKYVGEYKDDKYNGQGNYTHSNGKIKEGIFKNGKFQYAQKGTPPVIAKKSSPPSPSAAEIENDKLRREVAHLKKQIQSTITNANNKTESPFLPECAENPHTSLWDNCEGTLEIEGGKYTGEFKDGKRNGHGTSTYANGEKYVGQWKSGKMHGQGTLKYANGGVSEGVFKNNAFLYAQKGTPPVIAKKVSPSSTCEDSPLTSSPSKMSSWNNCKGTFTYPNGNKYLGEWKNGKKNGHGILIYANRTLYIGKWMSDKRHGQGTYTSSNGTVNKGIWESGKFRTAN